MPETLVHLRSGLSFLMINENDCNAGGACLLRWHSAQAAWLLLNRSLLLTAAFASITFADRCAAAERAMTTCGGVEISIVEVGHEVQDFSQLDARPRLIG